MVYCSIKQQILGAKQYEMHDKQYRELKFWYR